MIFLNQLIEQAKNPNGIIGSMMLRIMNTAHTNMNKWALEKIKMKEESVVLDVGCGGGKTILLLSKINTNAKIFGIDYSDQAVKDSLRANKNNVATGKVHIKQASVTDISFPENTFDIITAFQTHYFWSDLEESVNEVCRVLKPGGCFLISAELYKINYHMKSYKTKVEMEQLLKKTGFASVSFYEHANKKWICIKGIKENKSTNIG
ncbi:ubiquinone/menaquinone biosynthesis C-methylase UbiE [Metabacillus crassostreae]|uniref:class I SAM-dependent methyltransferase n=1 Tax=Metabacillus crassostreae TaxID=929098 RepID=UPI00195C50F7|nr:class I SAM-dependent methyltransferase [Metabacillus crassostreae]MBM7602700.1 ubiquinone/menaquinone biosynthesis C-methylase UbiE [Metabacillus crassostreae]